MIHIKRAGTLTHCNAAVTQVIICSSTSSPHSAGGPLLAAVRSAVRREIDIARRIACDADSGTVDVRVGGQILVGIFQPDLVCKLTVKPIDSQWAWLYDIDKSSYFFTASRFHLIALGGHPMKKFIIPLIAILTAALLWAGCGTTLATPETPTPENTLSEEEKARWEECIRLIERLLPARNGEYKVVGWESATDISTEKYLIWYGRKKQIEGCLSDVIYPIIREPYGEEWPAFAAEDVIAEVTKYFDLPQDYLQPEICVAGECYFFNPAPVVPPPEKTIEVTRVESIGTRTQISFTMTDVENADIIKAVLTVENTESGIRYLSCVPIEEL